MSGRLFSHIRLPFCGVRQTNTATRDTLDAGRLAARKTKIWALSGQIGLLGRFHGKTGLRFAPHGPIAGRPIAGHGGKTHAMALDT